MRLKVFLLTIIICFMSVVVWAEGNQTDNSQTTDNSVEYVIDLGDGNSVLVFGDNNSITLPASDDKSEAEYHSMITVSADDKYFQLIMFYTTYSFDNVDTKFEKIVFRIPAEDIADYLVWYEQ